MLGIESYRRAVLERVNICESEAKTPPILTPFPIRLQLGPANRILLALKHSRRAISAHTVRTGPLPRHTQAWIVWPRLMASSHQANRLLGVNPQQKLESYMRVCEKWEGCVCVCVCVCVFVCAHIPVDGGKESVAFDLLHSVGPGP